jgi:hypothetical protein
MIRLVRLDEILNPKCHKPSYEKLVDRLGFFLSCRVIDANKAVKLSYKLGSEEITFGSDIELELAIHHQTIRADHQQLISFAATVQRNMMPVTAVPVLPRATSLALATHHFDPTDDLNTNHPNNLVNFPTVRFDASGAPRGVVITSEGRCVTQTVMGPREHIQSVYAQDGFDSGCHYWSFQVLGKTSTPNLIGIGVGSATGYPHDYKDSFRMLLESWQWQYLAVGPEPPLSQ